MAQACNMLGLFPKHLNTSSRKGSCPLKMYASIKALFKEINNFKTKGEDTNL